MESVLSALYMGSQDWTQISRLMQKGLLPGEPTLAPSVSQYPSFPANPPPYSLFSHSFAFFFKRSPEDIDLYVSFIF